MMKSSNLSWIVVSDLKKARKFFTEAVGLKERTCAEEYGWAELTCEEGGATIGLAQENEEMGAGENAIITITVDHLEKTVAELKKKGVNLIGEIMEVPGHVKLQMFTDPDGNKFQLVQTL
jgi:predicted enzyme related to lactoylglutathione lyase